MPTIKKTGVKFPWQKERKPFEGMNTKDDFYNSSVWRKFRHGYIARNPLCVMCAAKGITTIGNHVDHIVSINEGGEKFNYANLQTLCLSCHSSKTMTDRWSKTKTK
jgi:5-methylcytosine-specific restriction enzyme A